MPMCKRRALTALRDEDHVAVAMAGGGAEEVVQRFPMQMMRAGSGDENAPRREQL